MYRLMIESGFASAHQLRGYQGKCEDLHGHNWRVQVMVKTKELNSIGIAIDFKDLKSHLKKILSELDHSFINEKEPFKSTNPSSENLASYIFNEFSKELGQQHISVDWVRVWESHTTFAQYSLQ